MEPAKAEPETSVRLAPQASWAGQKVEKDDGKDVFSYRALRMCIEGLFPSEHIPTRTAAALARYPNALDD